MSEKTRAELEEEVAQLRKRLETQARRIARLERASAALPKLSQKVDAESAALGKNETQRSRRNRDEPGASGSSASSSPDAAHEDQVRRWAAIFAHEMNQPLAAVLTTAQACVRLIEGAETIRPKVKPGEIADALGSLVRQSTYAAELVRRLRDWAMDAPLHREAVDLEAVVRHTAELLEGPLREAGIALEIEPLRRETDAKPPRVWGDPVQLQQVTVNLVRNAIEALQDAPAKDRRLTIRLFEDPGSEDAPGAAAAVAGGVAVIDHGPGLSVAMIDRLFTPLVSTKPHGMGLGLAISRRLVQAHGGRLWVEPNVPHGCAFHYSIPGEPRTP